MKSLDINELNELKKGSGIQSLLVGFTIIDLVARYGKPITFTEIYDETNISKGNLYKYLNTLTHIGILYRDPSGKYTLGSRMIDYVMSAVSSENFVERLIPYLQEISKKIGNTVTLQVWTHNGPMVVYMVNSMKMINIGAQIGSIMPIHSSTGKLFAAFGNDLQVKEWIESGLLHYNPKQIEEFEQEMEIIKEQKISFAEESLVSYVSAVSIPVFNYREHLIGTITVVGFKNDIPQDIEHPSSQYLIKMRDEISALFGAS